MYLLTFTFLIIGMLGIYTQVMAVEAERIYASQTGIGQDMVYWHQAAVSLAANVVNPASMSGGCKLAYVSNNTSSFPNYCLTGANVEPPNANVAINAIYPALGPTPYRFPASGPSSATYPSLPQGFTTTTYAWNSVAFSNNGGNFVMTYAGLPGAGGFISTATTTLGITDSDLYQQVKLSGVPIANFGYVTTVNGSQMLVTPATINVPGVGVEPVEYTLPSNVPSGVFALISGIGVCDGC